MNSRWSTVFLIFFLFLLLRVASSVFGQEQIQATVTIDGKFPETYIFDGLEYTSDGVMHIYLKTVQSNPTEPVLSVNGMLSDATDGKFYSDKINYSATDGSGNYRFICRVKSAYQGRGITAHAEALNSNSASCSVKGTYILSNPSAAETIYLILKVIDRTTGLAANQVISLDILPAGNPPPPDGTIESLQVNVTHTDQLIPPESARYYKCYVPPGQSILTVTIGTEDQASTNEDMMFSYGLPKPTPSDYPKRVYYSVSGQNGFWANIKPDSGSSSKSNEGASLIDPQEGWYYIMVNNTTSGITGRFWIRCSIQ